MKTKWMASDIGFEVREIQAGSRAAYVSMSEAKESARITEDGGALQQATENNAAVDHAAVRPSNRLFLTDRERKVTCWFWESWGFTLEATDVSFIAFGDNLIHEPIYQYGLHHDEDFSFLFENMKESIAKSDVAVINQETPLTDDPAKYSDYPQFGTPAQVGERYRTPDSMWLHAPRTMLWIKGWKESTSQKSYLRRRVSRVWEYSVRTKKNTMYMTLLSEMESGLQC